MSASAESGGRSRSQHSQFGRNSSIGQLLLDRNDTVVMLPNVVVFSGEQPPERSEEG